MKKQTIILLLTAVLGVLALQTKAVVEGIGKVGEYQVGNTLYELFLPDEPYIYNDIDIPDYYFANPDSWSISSILPIVGPNTSIPNPVAPVLIEYPSLPQDNDMVTLGRVLFYDKNLSANQSTSCASCHSQSLGFADNKAKSKGFLDGDTHRNAPNIADIPLTIHWKGLLWDRRATELEAMVELPVQDEVEMGMNFDDLVVRLDNLGYYDELFQKAYGSPTVTQDRITHAVSDFMRVLMPLNTKLDQGIASNFANFTPQEIQGRQIFMSDCWHCHTSVPTVAGETDMMDFSKMMASMSYPQNNGLSLDHSSDQGVASWTNTTTDVGRFNAPSLKNIELTAPYMHDGSLATLEAVVEFYSKEIKPDPNSTFSPDNMYGSSLPLPFTGFDYTVEEKAALLAFLRTLTDQSFVTDQRLSDPFVATEHSTSVSQNDPTLIDNIYPNPMAERATIQFQNPSRVLTHLRVYSLSGSLMTVGATVENRYTLERNNLPAGQYLVSVEQANRRAVHKLIVP